MDIFELVGILFWPGVIIFAIYAVIKRVANGPAPKWQPPQNYAINENDIRRKVAAEIRAQDVLYDTKAQKKVVEEMASTVEYFASNAYTATPSQNFSEPVASQTLAAADSSYETPWLKLQTLDGATILLYLGAFFLLASIGLYVGLGSGEGIKPILVAIITAVFYFGGLSLYKNSTRLKPAGITFAGIGMATLPMVGAATYYYALRQTNGPAVWLATSLFAIAMYTHAIRRLRSTLVSYLIVFSSLSVVLSGISSVGIAPLYFIQGMGVAGLLFALIARLMGRYDSLVSESYDRSAVFLVPFSVGMGALFAVQAGWVNTALSFGIGAFYYAYQTVYAGKYKEIYSAISQVSTIASVLCIVYATSRSTRALAVAAGLMSLGYIAAWLGWATKKPVGDLYRVCTKAIMLALPIISFAFLSSRTGLYWMPAVLLLVVAKIVYLYDRDEVSGALMVISLLLIPYLVGILGLGTAISVSSLGFVYVAIAAAAVVLRAYARRSMTVTDVSLQRVTLVVAMLSGAMLQWSMGNKVQLVVSIIEVVLVGFAAYFEEDTENWLAYAAILQLGWLGAFVDNVRLLCVMIAVALICNVVLVVRKKLPVHSWISVCLALSLPLIYGLGASSPKWAETDFRTVYFGMSAGLLAVRYLLRKRAVPAEPMLAMQFGYGSALAAGIVFGTQGGYVNMAVSFFVAGLMLVAISYIESSAAVIILAFVAGYASLLRLVTGYELSVNATVGIFITVSQVAYWLLRASGLDTLRAQYSRAVQVVVAGVIPLIGVTYFDYSIFALSLALFGAILAREVWQKGQNARELALLIVHASALWWLYDMGVRELQVYTQSTAVVVGIFAWWRRRSQDLPATINSYLWAAVSIFTVPMVFQAISSGNTTYSYLVLVEHVMLILISIAYKRATFAWWGIGVVVLSVLYQMRKLKYAALAFLGLFVISLAIYFLLKSSRQDPKK
jgi:hypothetical protein